MASPWITYSPHTPPPQDVQTSHLADNAQTVAVASELMASDASLRVVSIDSAKRQALGHAGRNSSVSSIPPFNSTNGTHTESTDKGAPIFVSATSFGFEFREAELYTRTSVDKQHTSTPLQAPQSIDGERYAPTSEGTDIAAVGPQSSLSSSTFDRDLFASSPTKNTHAVAPISAADDVTPSPPPDSATLTPTPDAITTLDVGITDSPNTGASTPTVKLSLTQSPERARGKSERQPRKRSNTGGSAGSISVVQSQYSDMVFEMVPRTHNLLSSLFTWILLAGFVVLPGTFTHLENIQESGEVERVLQSLHNLPLLIIGYGCCGLGAFGMLLFWWRWAHNYVWLLNKIFIPGMLNGLSGVISTISSLYGAHSLSGTYSVPSIVTLAVTGGCTIICGFLTAIYSLWKLDRVKRRHLREMEQLKGGEEQIGDVHYF